MTGGVSRFVRSRRKIALIVGREKKCRGGFHFFVSTVVSPDSPLFLFPGLRGGMLDEKS